MSSKTQEERRELANRLRKAERELRQVIAEMDEERVTCPHCGVVRFTHFDEHQIAESLNGAIGRARRARLTLEDDEEGDTQP